VPLAVARPGVLYGISIPWGGMVCQVLLYYLMGCTRVYLGWVKIAYFISLNTGSKFFGPIKGLKTLTKGLKKGLRCFI